MKALPVEEELQKLSIHKQNKTKLTVDPNSLVRIIVIFTKRIFCVGVTIF